MDENKITEERIPAGIVTMLLAGYRETNKRLTYAIIALAVCWLCTVGGSCIIWLDMKCRSAITVILKTARLMPVLGN